MLKSLLRTDRVGMILFRHYFASVLLLVINTSVLSYDAFGPGASEPKTAKEEYGEGVRSSGPLSPEAELAGFHVPPGFAVELVASEPAIQKPLNMAFDDRGRLWVTNTIEYPYAAPDDRKPRDSIRVLEDEDRDGLFEKVTTFADELNIPIGILPTSDGAIAFSIPNIVKLRDTDGNGICDQRESMLGPFDTTRDTHGMVNALRMGIDGWVYACHGFNNESKVKASDGSEVILSSGNTFRFRSDGSRVEHVSHGQVNPFGMTTDRWGNWFTADCHSKPITQLLRGGYFSSFGRSDDGLGFVPSMMEHSHGSTAICGLEIYNAESYPIGYRNQFYSGNVMTSRINRNAIVEHGATLRAKELPDFLTSDDPWFRPVDIQLGPDGALYVADFYNKIIGHYEVPLTHPERDRERGRIWRIVYRGEHLESTASRDATAQSCIDNDIQLLADGNATVRRLARERIRRVDDSIVLERLRNGLQDNEPMRRIECGWELMRRGALTNPQRLALLRDKDAMVRAHSLQIASESANWTKKIRRAVRKRLLDSDPRVVRFAVEAIGNNADASDVLPLLERLNSLSPKDSILRQAIRIAVRDALGRAEIASSFDAVSILQKHALADEFADILLGLPTPTAATWLMHYLEDIARPIDSMRRIISHVAFRISDEEFPGLVELLKQRGSDLKTEIDLFLLVHGVSRKRSETTEESLKNWGNAVAETWYREFTTLIASDTQRSVGWFSSEGESWRSEKRAATDKVNDEWYRSSFPLGEKYEGVLQSDTFAAPEKLAFWVVGHNGPPKGPDTRKNRIRLVDDLTKSTIYEAYPPRSDIAVRIEWDLTEWKDRSVHFECLDQDAGKSYAWIGFGRFDFPPLQPSAVQLHLEEGLKLIRAARPVRLADELLMLARREAFGVRSQCDIIEAWATLHENVQISQLALAMRLFPTSAKLLQQLLNVMTEKPVDHIGAEMIKTILTDRSLPEQRNLARLLAKKRASVTWLLQGLREGWISAEVLRDSMVKQGVESFAEPDDRANVEAMLASLPSIDSHIEELAKKIAARMETKMGDPENGMRLFQKSCANCHQLAGHGSLVGPQLDGAIARSALRLLEDILFPDRNIDQAFRTTSLLIDDDLVRVGLLQNETADFVDLIENNGKSVRIAVDSISERKLSSRSLMPTGLHELLGEDGLIDVLTYLHSKRKTSPPSP